PPSAPAVTGSRSGTDAVFSWPGVPTASSYIIRYNINGGGWIAASENSTETTISIPAHHGDTVSVEVRARNTTGTSAASTASTTIPLWLECSLQNGWVNYAAGYNNCSFTKTRHGVVVIRGLIKDGTRGGIVDLFQLPEGYRPVAPHVFTGIITSNGSARLQVESSGRVRIVDTTAGGASSFISLDDILFISSDAQYSWTNLTYQNGWQDYS